MTQGSQMKKTYLLFIIVVVFATTFFNLHLQNLDFAASGCGKSRQFEYLQKQSG